MSQSNWRLDGSVATLHGGAASLDVSEPASGLTRLLGDDSRLFGVTPTGEATLALTDAYTRGQDLVAAYAPTDGFPFRTEVYWRCHSEEGEPLRLTLIVSVETDMLDTHPSLSVVSQVAGSPASLFAARADDSLVEMPEESTNDPVAAATPLAGSGIWFEAIHPTDLREAEYCAGHSVAVTRSEWRLFARFLEKGVIRRARLTGAVIDKHEEAAGRFAAFASQPPPLTA